MNTIDRIVRYGDNLVFIEINTIKRLGKMMKNNETSLEVRYIRSIHD